MHCSCPDWGVPCKHLAAVCYVLAEEFDRDPFAMLAWRGKARDDLLAALRAVRSAPRSRSSAGGAGRAGVPEPGEPAAPLAESPDGFWSARLSPARLRALSAPAGPVTPDLLLRMFPPPPVPVRGQDLAEVLTPAYRRLTADGAVPLPFGEIG
jgi:uncharacterized Zn finger protein